MSSALCLLPYAYCLMPLPYAYCIMPTAGRAASTRVPLPVPYCLLPTALCLCLMPTALCLLQEEQRAHVSHCLSLLPFAYCLMPLPYAYCLIPPAGRAASTRVPLPVPALAGKLVCDIACGGFHTLLAVLEPWQVY